MRKEYIDEQERNDGSYVVKKNRKTNVFAFILCILLAFFIWAYTESVDMGRGERPEGAQPDGQVQQSDGTV